MALGEAHSYDGGSRRHGAPCHGYRL